VGPKKSEQVSIAPAVGLAAQERHGGPAEFRRVELDQFAHPAPVRQRRVSKIVDQGAEQDVGVRCGFGSGIKRGTGRI
jgi:hypothetical protein